jgi:hypothetical protein
MKRGDIVFIKENPLGVRKHRNTKGNVGVVIENSPCPYIWCEDCCWAYHPGQIEKIGEDIELAQQLDGDKFNES